VTTHLFVAALLLCTACGGTAKPDPLAGGGDDQPEGRATSQPKRAHGWQSLTSSDATRIDRYRTKEYKRQWALEAIRTAEAYALLEKNGLAVAGLGSVVAVSDAGIDFSHGDLVGAKHAKGHTPIAGMTDGSGYTDAHGTHIAGTIAGRRDSLGMHGVAFDAKIVAFSERRVIDIAAAKKAGVHVVSISWAGGVCNNEHASTATRVATACDVANSDDGLKLGAPIAGNKLDLVNDKDMAVFRNVLRAAASNGVVLVASLAQGAEERHGFPVGFATDTQLAGKMIAVGAVDRKGRLISMGCGKSPEAVTEHCLVAPGAGVVGPAANKHAEGSGRTVDDRKYYSWTGTSHAVPLVSGAVAVLRAAWPKASSALIVKALLSGAKRVHAPGESKAATSPSYGRGRLDLAAAVEYLGRALSRPGGASPGPTARP